MLKIAVIGLGDISKTHISAIQDNPNVDLVAVCDSDELLRESVPHVNFYRDFHDMLKKEALDCVHICLPHYLHYPATKACIEKGVNVFLEKPISLNTIEGIKLVRLEKKHQDIKICVCFQNRYNETFEMLKEFAQSGQFGNLIGIKGLVTWFRPKSYYDRKPWRGSMKYAGGGVMINQALHTVDLMQLLGGEIESIRGSIDQLLDYGIDVEDTATAHIKFKNGAKGLFFATVANVENSSVELKVIFEKETFTIKDGILSRIDENGLKEELLVDKKVLGTKFYYGASHAKLINLFYSCISNNTQNYVHVEDALTSIKMIDAIRRSSEVKKEIKMEDL
ncbi:Gfo/Idh/MocA family oxidoreductase [Neobacillus sp. PS3-12]|uniref:Gfo/Idh/MocA family protein n=1 Tax=Neobacillus sp. PS3-12 TaxID=3070677 RepID=UPI0027E00A13|nr:Gfo/Idh/MocA family oxidoreductase [Neobacillus sp. PS3-12]WML54938.1 Gfo/Idh/MocA family oxidoreductase [Neobacillus sp. PS3-12]